MLLTTATSWRGLSTSIGAHRETLLYTIPLLYIYHRSSLGEGLPLFNIVAFKIKSTQILHRKEGGSLSLDLFFQVSLCSERVHASETPKAYSTSLRLRDSRNSRSPKS